MLSNLQINAMSHAWQRCPLMRME